MVRRGAFLGETSKYGPALVYANGQILLSWTGIDRRKRLNFRPSLDGLDFGQRVTTHQRSHRAPALTFFNLHYYVAWTGRDKKHHLNVMRSKDGKTWTDKVTLRDTSISAPALTVFKRRLYISWLGTDRHNRLNIMRSVDGKTWTDKFVLDKVYSGGGPALGMFRHRIYVVWGTGYYNMDTGRFYPGLDVRWSSSGLIWTNKSRLGPGTATRAALAVHARRFYVSWGWGGTWQPFEARTHDLHIMRVLKGRETTMHIGVDTVDGPALTSMGSALLLAWTSNSHGHHLNTLYLFEIGGRALPSRRKILPRLVKKKRLR